MVRPQRRLTDREKRLIAVIAVVIFVLGEGVLYATGVIQGFLSAAAAGMFLGAFGVLLGAVVARAAYGHKT